MMLAVGICFIPCAIYMNQLFTFVARSADTQIARGSDSDLATSVVAPFTVPFKLALVLAIGLAIPFLLYQAWAFVAPGLYHSTRKKLRGAPAHFPAYCCFTWAPPSPITRFSP